MKRVLKYVYYCEYCNKRSLSGGHLSHHEERCTANPKRECGMCGNIYIEKDITAFKERFTLVENYGDLIGPKQKGYLDADLAFDFEQLFEEKQLHSHRIVWKDKPVTLDEITEATNNCPCCTLAILRQVGFNKHYFNFPKFDFQKEKEEYWQEIIREQRSNYEHY